MMDALKSLFSGADAAGDTAAAGNTDRELPLAAAALLLEVGYADFEIRDDELDAISAALRQRFGFSEGEVEELLDEACHEHHAGHSLHPFLTRINQSFSLERKVRLITDMWRVAYADRRLDKYEEHRIRKIANLLHVPHSRFIRAKLTVREELGLD